MCFFYVRFCLTVIFIYIFICLPHLCIDFVCACVQVSYRGAKLDLFELYPEHKLGYEIDQLHIIIFFGFCFVLFLVEGGKRNYEFKKSTEGVVFSFPPKNRTRKIPSHLAPPALSPHSLFIAVGCICLRRSSSSGLRQVGRRWEWRLRIKEEKEMRRKCDLLCWGSILSSCDRWRGSG